MLPLQITVKDITVSPALESHIRDKSEKLQRYYDRICSCRVVIESPQKHKHNGKLYKVRIDLSVPGKELVVTRKQNEDIYIAIRDAFNALERQLEDHARKRHGRVKTHTGVMKGHVARIKHDEGYGFIEGKDGNEYYFSNTSVSYPPFSQLTIGDAVEYMVEETGGGQQAQHVVRDRNHHTYQNQELSW